MQVKHRLHRGLEGPAVRGGQPQPGGCPEPDNDPRGPSGQCEDTGTRRRPGCSGAFPELAFTDKAPRPLQPQLRPWHCTGRQRPEPAHRRARHDARTPRRTGSARAGPPGARRGAADGAAKAAQSRTSGRGPRRSPRGRPPSRPPQRSLPPPGTAGSRLPAPTWPARSPGPCAAPGPARRHGVSRAPGESERSAAAAAAPPPAAAAASPRAGRKRHWVHGDPRRRRQGRPGHAHPNPRWLSRRRVPPHRGARRCHGPALPPSPLATSPRGPAFAAASLGSTRPPRRAPHGPSAPLARGAATRRGEQEGCRR